MIILYRWTLFIYLYRWTEVDNNCLFTYTGGLKFIVIGFFLSVQVDRS